MFDILRDLGKKITTVSEDFEIASLTEIIFGQARLQIAKKHYLCATIPL